MVLHIGLAQRYVGLGLAFYKADNKRCDQVLEEPNWSCGIDNFLYIYPQHYKSFVENDSLNVTLHLMQTSTDELLVL